MAQEVTLTQFCEIHCKETWNGTKTAYKNGAKCAVTGADCNYLFRQDFSQAWLRGNGDAERFMAEGGVILTGVKELRAEVARLRKRIKQLEAAFKEQTL